MKFEIADIPLFKQKALQWAANHEVCSCLDSNSHSNSYSKFDALIAAGVKSELIASAGDAFNKLNQFRQQHTGWLTGFLGYDLKNETEQLYSVHTDNLHFPDLYFFEPEHLIIIKGEVIEILSDNAEQIFAEVNKQKLYSIQKPNDLNLQARFSREEYVQTFDRIKQHINRGDIYVTNFCQEFYVENAVIHPVSIFSELNRISRTPFASFFQYYGQYILCASPERFLAKRGDKLISQPIKGTARRGATKVEDNAIKHNLRNNLKEQQENVMVVDMVRNDLTKSAVSGSVKTEELFGIYSFKQVHQMISTVTCKLQYGLSAVEAIRNTFPMGSMTGAPKVSAMQLIEQYERTRRGVYSGAVGYFSPDDDFDFNVVIRTILYSAANEYLSFEVGSAITFDAKAEDEYDECLLKAKAILKVLQVKL
ncbi:anthranilate synthase component I family protein [Mucilaginibacter aquatilis]|uniref:Aminodeoxychorismate synthase component I n=1 Tax=Mucilaginibacter aquatilis TaxID=1517760 RepID=A0A6I4I8T8_9SPHI|nr:anthranilate synthase component I family protein [Mucilaginibacter aquatilis]MVN89879.1 aminodeoxychorismate synthase component I [Mucilaginibacter aquatilis]